MSDESGSLIYRKDSANHDFAIDLEGLKECESYRVCIMYKIEEDVSVCRSKSFRNQPHGPPSPPIIDALNITAGHISFRVIQPNDSNDIHYYMAKITYIGGKEDFRQLPKSDPFIELGGCDFQSIQVSAVNQCGPSQDVVAFIDYHEDPFVVTKLYGTNGVVTVQAHAKLRCDPKVDLKYGISTNPVLSLEESDSEYKFSDLESLKTFKVISKDTKSGREGEVQFTTFTTKSTIGSATSTNLSIFWIAVVTILVTMI